MSSEQAAVRYSILLPTRNGAALLPKCIESVLGQAYDDFELVISDNSSEDETAEILAGYAAHPRVRLLSQDTPLDVTASWSAPLEASSGERIAMIGDDDLLLPGYFERLDALLAEHADPDVLVHNAYTFAYPGLAGTSVSHYQSSFFESNDMRERGEVPDARRRAYIDRLFRFDFCIPLNMQVAVIARRALDRFPGGLFRRPFPDIYASIGLLLTAARWVASPERLLVIGVSPDSFGHQLFAPDSDVRARAYLGIDLDFDGLLPGSVLASGHHETLAALKRDFPAQLAGVEIDRREYVLQQVYAWYYQRRLGFLSARQLVDRVGLLGMRDWLSLPRVALRKLRPDKLRRLASVRGEDATAGLWPGMLPLPEVADIVDFAGWVAEQQPRTLAEVG